MAPGRSMDGPDVAIVNAFESRGGAARAARRLHRGLLAAGVVSRMVVQERASGDFTVCAPEASLARAFARVRPVVEGLAIRRHRRLRGDYSPAAMPGGLPARLRALAPRIVHLHWMNAGYARIEELGRLAGQGVPIVWTLHDLWPLTGGCHYGAGCRAFETHCGACPVLGSRRVRDASHRHHARKLRHLRHLPVTLVAPSHWMAEQVRRSAVFADRPVEVIANGLDLERWRPLERRVARDLLRLPGDAPLVLFGAERSDEDLRKGFDLLVPALRALHRSRPDARAVWFGADPPRAPLDLGLPVHHLGHLADDLSLAIAYAAADVFVAPSREDNLPNTVAESLACGTPVVAFDVGGLRDLVDPGENGQLARPLDPEDLARQLAWTLSDPLRREKLAQNARAKALASLSIERCVAAHRSLYERLTTHSRGSHVRS